MAAIQPTPRMSPGTESGGYRPMSLAADRAVWYSGAASLGFVMRYAILTFLLLVGCSTSDPIRVGDNRYMISTTSYTGWSTRAGRIGRAMDDANDFCRKRGKVAQLQSDNSQGQPAITPVSENVVFACVIGP